MPQRILLAPLAFDDERPVVLRPDALFQLPPALVLDSALVARFGGLAPEFPDVRRKVVGEIRALPRDPDKTAPEVVAVAALRRLAKALLAIATGGNQVV